jgi:hypothetical protein
MRHKFYIVFVLHLFLISCNNIREDKATSNFDAHIEISNNTESVFLRSIDSPISILICKLMSPPSKVSETDLYIKIYKHYITDTVLTFALSEDIRNEAVRVSLHISDELREGQIYRESRVESIAISGKIEILIKETNKGDSSKYISVNGRNLVYNNKELKLDSFFIKDVLYKGNMEPYSSNPELEKENPELHRILSKFKAIEEENRLRNVQQKPARQ